MALFSFSHHLIHMHEQVLGRTVVPSSIYRNAFLLRSIRFMPGVYAGSDRKTHA
jgi:hypothetical protein